MGRQTQRCFNFSSPSRSWDKKDTKVTSLTLSNSSIQIITLFSKTFRMGGRNQIKIIPTLCFMKYNIHSRRYKVKQDLLRNNKRFLSILFPIFCYCISRSKKKKPHYSPIFLNYCLSFLYVIYKYVEWQQMMKEV